MKRKAAIVRDDESDDEDLETKIIPKPSSFRRFEPVVAVVNPAIVDPFSSGEDGPVPIDVELGPIQ